ncbi:MAG: hypothetical protein LJE95_05960 [Acidobacteria bacterium]|jgi:hypothetical protein|nr:hypothetical protein [Acidobacteriota bacterium]
MRTLTLRWVSFVSAGAAATAVALATLQLPAVIPLHHFRIAWTLARFLIEF